jgi:hypothetical protein
MSITVAPPATGHAEASAVIQLPHSADALTSSARAISNSADGATEMAVEAVEDYRVPVLQNLNVCVSASPPGRPPIAGRKAVRRQPSIGASAGSWQQGRRRPKTSARDEGATATSARRTESRRYPENGARILLRVAATANTPACARASAREAAGTLLAPVAHAKPSRSAKFECASHHGATEPRRHNHAQICRHRHLLH